MRRAAAGSSRILSSLGGQRSLSPCPGEDVRKAESPSCGCQRLELGAEWAGYKLLARREPDPFEAASLTSASR